MSTLGPLKVLAETYNEGVEIGLNVSMLVGAYFGGDNKNCY